MVQYRVVAVLNEASGECTSELPTSSRSNKGNLLLCLLCTEKKEEDRGPSTGRSEECRIAPSRLSQIRPRTGQSKNGRVWGEKRDLDLEAGEYNLISSFPIRRNPFFQNNFEEIDKRSRSCGFSILLEVNKTRRYLSPSRAHHLPFRRHPSLSLPGQDVQNALFRPFVSLYVVFLSPYDHDRDEPGQPPSVS